MVSDWKKKCDEFMSIGQVLFCFVLSNKTIKKNWYNWWLVNEK